MLIFNKKQIKEIITHARKELPNECCGIIAGKDTHVEKIIRISNETPSPIEYSMDGVKLKQVLESLDKAGLDFLGVYHSHPASKAYPSGSDISKAVFPEIDYLIISLSDRNNPDIRNYKIEKNAVIVEKYIVTD